MSVENFSNFQTTITPLTGDYIVGYSFADPINHINPFETKTTLKQIFDAYTTYSSNLSGITPAQLSVGHLSWDAYGNVTVFNQLNVTGSPSYFGDGTIRAAIYPDNSDSGVTIEAADYTNINKKNLYLASHGGNVTVGTVTPSTSGLTVSGNISASGTIFGAGAVPAGAIMTFAMSASPAGWLACDGSTYSVSTYSNLFAAIGYTYGGTGGSFVVPNLQGQFIRGWTSNLSTTSVDPLSATRTLGSTQTDVFKSHSHTTPTGAYSQYNETGGGGSVGSLFNGASNTGLTGDVETRPKNIALLYCIKY